MEEISLNEDTSVNLSPRQALNKALLNTYDFIDQDLLNVINRDLSKISAGVIRLLVNKINQKEVFESIIKTLDNKKYIIGADYIKEIKIGAEGEFQETILKIGSVEAAQSLGPIEEAVEVYKKSKNVAKCCANIKNIVLRPKHTPDFIEIREPTHALECYEFIIKDIDGRDYEVINDHCPYILECTVLDDEEQRLVLNPKDAENIAAKINQKIAAIVDQKDFATSSIVELNKDQDLRLKFIEDLSQQVRQLPSCVVSSEQDSVKSSVAIDSDNYLYIISKNRISRIGHDQDSEIISKKLSDRYMLLEAYEEINQAFDIIFEQAIIFSQCCEKVLELSQLEDCPDFIIVGEEGALLVKIDDDYYAINFDENGRPAAYRIDEGEDDEEDALFLLAPQQIEPFVSSLQVSLGQIN